ncbi:MAG: 3'(2'),5'-bisphosphate nucleotidase [Desulfobacterales bacterium]|nr:3'(2'),5'-bisphosphate nucleotidase [Desulfobacterales bacterium]
MIFEKELTVAISAVQKASRICKMVSESSSPISSVQKEDHSPVSIADLASQALITLALRDYYPGDPIVGEEEAKTIQQHEHLGNKVLDLIQKETHTLNLETLLEIMDYGSKSFDSNKRFWTVDPIDGTKGFLRGDQFAVALALLEQGQVVLGVLGCPNMAINSTESQNRGVLLYAVKGHGAFMMHLNGQNTQKVFVDSISKVTMARFCESVEINHASHDQHQKIADALGITASPCRMDSQVKYAALARGQASIYLRLPRKKDYREKIWDHAAGSIIVEEAGGKVTDFKGNPLQFNLGKNLENNIGILATNKHLHTQVLEAIAEVI